jgi:hypothetical protein
MRNLQQWIGRSLVLMTALAMTTATVGCGSDSEEEITVATDGGETAEEGGEAAEEGGEAAEEGGEAAEEGGEAAEEGGEAAEEGGEAAEEGGEAAEEGGEAAEEGGEAAEEGGEATEEEGGEATEEEGGEGPADGCPEMDLTGSWDVQFVVSLKPEPTTVWMNIEASGDDNCYTGEVIAPSDNSDLAVVTSAKISGGALVLQFDDFNIPPGQTALLPDGGTAAVTLTANSWTSGSMCGDIVYNLVEPFATEDTGTFAAVETCSGWTISEEGAATCEGLTEGDIPAECAAEEEGGEAAEEGGEAAEEGGETAEEGGEATTAVTWSELNTALEADCSPCHFGGYAEPFDNEYALWNTQHMITRIDDNEMPPSGDPSPELVEMIQSWEDGGFLD